MQAVSWQARDSGDNARWCTARPQTFTKASYMRAKGCQGCLLQGLEAATQSTRENDAAADQFLDELLEKTRFEN
jgi:hypothetical protein